MSTPDLTRTSLQPSVSTVDRFWSKVHKEEAAPAHRLELGPCWQWTASLNSYGYGQFHERRRVNTPAHIFARRLLVGPTPPGLVLDHLCGNRACCNPDHLEPVTQRENVLRGVGPTALNAQRTHCVNGHLFDEENTYVRGHNRECRTCRREAARRYEARKHLESAA